MFRNFYDVSFNKKSINKKYTAWSIWVEVFGKSFNSTIWKKLSRWHEELLLNLRRIFFKICIEKNFTNGEDLFGKFSATKYLDSTRKSCYSYLSRLICQILSMREIQQEGKAWTPVTSATLSYKTETGSKITGSRCKSNEGGSLLLRGKIRARMKVEQRSIIFRVSDLMAIDFSQTLSSLVFLVPGKNRYLTT